MSGPEKIQSVVDLELLVCGHERQLLELSLRNEKAIQYLDAVRFMPGAVLIHEGRRSPGAFLLLEGQIDVHKNVPGKAERVLTSPIPVGEWFGLVSLLDGLPATATVMAQAESVVVAMGRADFWKVVQSVDDARKDRCV